MKFLVLSSILGASLLSAPIATAVAAPISPAYVLNCPQANGTSVLISPKRKAWIAAGLDVQSQGTTLKDEIAAHTARISRFSPSAAKWIFEAVTKNFELIDFQPAIRVQRDPLGLPATIEGCETVPLFFALRDRLPGGKWWIGDLDSWRQLAPIDQMLLLMEQRSLEYELLGRLLSNQILTLSLQEFATISERHRRADLLFQGLAVQGCTWWNPEHPRECLSSVNQTIHPNGYVQGMLGQYQKLGFYPSGKIQWADIAYGSFPFLRGRKDCTAGRAEFNEAGGMEKCIGFQLDNDQRIRLDWSASFDFEIKFDHGADGYRFSHLAYDSRGQIVYAASGGVSYGRYLEHAEYDPEFLPEKWWSSRAYSTVTGFYPSKRFRSGVLSHELRNREMREYWVEASESGSFIRQVELPKRDDYDHPVDVVDSLFHYVNDADEDRHIQIAKAENAPKQVIFVLDPTYLSESRCRPRYDKKTFELLLAPHCVAVGRIFSVVSHERSQR